MASINHVISLGIGSPAAIKEFITFGLQIGEAAPVAAIAQHEFRVKSLRTEFKIKPLKTEFKVLKK